MMEITRDCETHKIKLSRLYKKCKIKCNVSPDQFVSVFWTRILMYVYMIKTKQKKTKTKKNNSSSARENTMTERACPFLSHRYV